jgi:hypothetical protein
MSQPFHKYYTDHSIQIIQVLVISIGVFGLFLTWPITLLPLVILTHGSWKALIKKITRSYYTHTCPECGNPTEYNDGLAGSEHIYSCENEKCFRYLIEYNVNRVILTHYPSAAYRRRTVWFRYAEDRKPWWAGRGW